jgi:hypothetical protein
MKYNTKIFIILIVSLVAISMIAYKMNYRENYIQRVYNIKYKNDNVAGIYKLTNSSSSVVSSDDIIPNNDIIGLNYWIGTSGERINELISELNKIYNNCVPYLNIGLIETNNNLENGPSFSISPVTGTPPKQDVSFILPKGRKGPNGLQGADGDKGKIGPNGDIGQRGDDGIFIVPRPNTSLLNRLI